MQIEGLEKKLCELHLQKNLTIRNDKPGFPLDRPLCTSRHTDKFRPRWLIFHSETLVLIEDPEKFTILFRTGYQPRLDEQIFS